MPNSSGNHTDVQSIAHDTDMATNAPQCVRTPQNGLRTPDSLFGDAKHAVNEMDGIGSHMDALNNPGTGSISNGEGVSTYLAARDMNRAIDETEGLGRHADMSNGQTDTQSIQTDVLTCVNKAADVRTPQIKSKSLNLPAGSATSLLDVTDGCRSHTDRLDMHTDVQNGANKMETPANEPKPVRTRQIRLKPPYSPNEAAWQRSGKPNACGDLMDTSSARTDMHSIETDTKLAENT